ncbi:unnamed protein product [marine sediment metagenome]|uniref:Uncharacterized protein n=1 Tax=marine sediment metagenome TaxID=412755 RepID=X1RVN3_9ZZZZ
MVRNKSYDDFGIALEKLRKKAEVSYDTISFEIQVASSYIWNLVHMRRSTLPKDEIMKKIAGYFNKDPSYFYEWRLKRMLEFIDNNREFLDHCLRQAKRTIKKISDKPEEALEDFEKIERSGEEIKEKRGEI